MYSSFIYRRGGHRRDRAHSWGARLGAVAVCAVVVAGLCTPLPAAAEDHVPPTVVPSVNGTGSLPGGIVVRWAHGEQGVWDYSVERQLPYRRWDNVHPQQFSLYDGGLTPSTKYSYRVCAYFVSEDGEVACSEWAQGETSPQTAEESRRPARPWVVEHQAGHTWLGLKWEGGYDYDSYFVNISGPFGTAKGPHELRTIHHADDGTWGYQRIDGLLPGRRYEISVQGCTKSFFGLFPDNCWDWAPTYSAFTQTYPLHAGPDTCAPPFVWREAFPSDQVCVESHRRTQVATDNAQAQSRRQYTCTPPNCTFTAPDTCKVPFVWRQARPDDHVCVPVPERSKVAEENALASQRRAAPA